MISDNDGILEFRDTSGKLCGCYHYTDPYKSFFRGLYTPKAHDVVSPPPSDHPHHKGLQYGLCAKDVNFWEEDANSEPGHRRIGRQVTEKLHRFDSGFSQEIVWRDDVCVSFQETRKISMQPTTSGYLWTWQTVLTAERDVVLDISAWPGPGYCGLGLRLAPDLFLNKSTVTCVPPKGMAACVASSGSVVQSVTIQGTETAVTFEQNTKVHKDVLFIQGCEPNNPEKFAFVSLGPTNGAGFTVKKGNTLKGGYLITVADAT